MTFTADFVTNKPLPFARMRQLLEDIGGGLQEGVLGQVGDFHVVQRAAGGANMSVDVQAGAGWINIDTGARNGLAHVYSDAVANGAVTSAHATLPRIDQVVIQYNDSSLPAGVGGDIPTLRVIAGVATSGATLDNRTGAAALPNDALRIADVLVPAASSSVVNANIRDRRPWARGAYWAAILGPTYPAASTSYVGLIASSGARQRLETSGNVLEMVLSAEILGNLANHFYFNPFVDAAQMANAEFKQFVPASSAVRFCGQWLNSPLAGSHLLEPQVKADAVSGNLQGYAHWTIVERVSTNTNNS